MRKIQGSSFPVIVVGMTAMFLSFAATTKSAQGAVIVERSIVADSSIRSGTPATSGGFHNNNTILTGFNNPAGNQIMRALVRADSIPPAPANTRLRSAELWLYSDLSNGYNEPASIHRMKTAWSETATLSWNQNGAGGNWGAPGMLAGTDYLATSTDAQNMPSSAGFVKFDVTADVHAWYAGGNNYGWAILNPNETNMSDLIRFRTREEATAAWKPKLVLTYETIPEPSVAMLLMLGGGILIRMRRQWIRTLSV